MRDTAPGGPSEGEPMAFKVNYAFQKAERDRAKQAKKEAKRREKEGQDQQDGASGTAPAGAAHASDAALDIKTDGEEEGSPS